MATNSNDSIGPVMKYTMLAVGWALSLVVTYYIGWFAGLKDAPTVAARSASVISSTVEYSILALIVLAIAGVGYFYATRNKAVGPSAS